MFHSARTFRCAGPTSILLCNNSLFYALQLCMFPVILSRVADHIPEGEWLSRLSLCTSNWKIPSLCPSLSKTVACLWVLEQNPLSPFPAGATRCLTLCYDPKLGKVREGRKSIPVHFCKSKIYHLPETMGQDSTQINLRTDTNLQTT